jgi:ABC-type branched-subunit amino acid transport system permease subunit
MLATGDLATIEQCTCGSIHVTIGAVTLRLSADALALLAAATTEAARTVMLDRALRPHDVHRGAAA